MGGASLRGSPRRRPTSGRSARPYLRRWSATLTRVVETTTAPRRADNHDWGRLMRQFLGLNGRPPEHLILVAPVAWSRRFVLVAVTPCTNTFHESKVTTVMHPSSRSAAWTGRAARSRGDPLELAKRRRVLVEEASEPPQRRPLVPSVTQLASDVRVSPPQHSKGVGGARRSA